MLKQYFNKKKFTFKKKKTFGTSYHKFGEYANREKIVRTTKTLGERLIYSVGNKHR